MHRQLAAALLSPFVRQRLGFFVAKEHAETLEAVNELVAAGKIRPVLDRSYPLFEAGDAVRRLQDGSGLGRSRSSSDHGETSHSHIR
jgi:NADPH:quinone reductase-like Zn-dependent oxidoreductase